MASINSLIRLITSSSEVIRVFGSSSLTRASSWAACDGDEIAILRNKLKVRTDLKNRSHKRCQTVRTQFSKNDVAVFYWSVFDGWMFVYRLASLQKREIG
jgi:hypothetical protein